MARSRNIKPSFFLNEILGTMDPIISLLFAGLWCLADREGRLEDRPARIKASLFPYRDSLDINRYLTVLSEKGFILRYEVDGQKLILVLNFKKHQAPHHTERGSTLPPPSVDSINGCLLTVRLQESDGGNPPDSLIPDSLIPSITDSPLPSPSARVDERPMKIISIWNEKTKDKLAAARLTPKRKSLILSSLKVEGWAEDFEKACEYVASDPFFCGQNDRHWVAGLDYLLRPGKVTELAEKASVPRKPRLNGKRTEEADAAFIEQLSGYKMLTLEEFVQKEKEAAGHAE